MQVVLMRLLNTIRNQLIRLMYAGGADEIAEHNQETADKINVCRWC
jgi:hypothetical protein